MTSFNQKRHSLIAIINISYPRIRDKIIIYEHDKIWFPIFKPEYQPITKACIQQKTIDKINKESSPFKRLNNTFAYMIRLSLRHKNKRYEWETILGYTSIQLKIHLEKKFTKGMTWQKFHKGEIHLDHLLPISKFNFEKVEDIDFHRCWALKNLQPLWAKDNRKKSAKIKNPIQTSLIFK